MSDPDFLLIGLVAAFAVGVFSVLTVGSVLVVRDTIRGRGKWGFNLKPPPCSQCGEPAPLARRPASWKQALWGGWTCKECGYELDKWGQPVEEQPFPAKWSANLHVGDPQSHQLTHQQRHEAFRAHDEHLRGDNHG